MQHFMCVIHTGSIKKRFYCVKIKCIFLHYKSHQVVLKNPLNVPKLIRPKFLRAHISCNKDY